MKQNSSHATFTLRGRTCPPVNINHRQLPQAEQVKYLGMHLDRRLTWKKHILYKRKQLRLKLYQMYWLIVRKSKLSLDNKVLLYESILKPIWSYGIHLWGTASKSNISIIQRFQNKVLRAIVAAPYYILNKVIERDIPLEPITSVIQRICVKYFERVSVHPNVLANQLNMRRDTEVRRLKRLTPPDLITEHI
ncbi:hypothetical protein GWI33_005660 [Rhynchophorus ferrugineus]|uniref:Uncharacterized protein n=1 Tax=Rhynchophorus ferrugineus TaxID=354439 RepID=A0A834MNY1_RHYFE|nr:hypothetical protein GWI33_005660 [Rhynchophorus ferrugineus]